MGRIAFVFSGQGDQFPGMGKELYEQYPAAREVFDLCSQVRPDLKELCFAGSAEQLKETVNTQPALFAMEVAAAQTLEAKGVKADAVAGFSLGEVAAAAFAGLFDIKTGFSLVSRRGALMQADAEKVETAMAAVVKLDQATVEKLCAEHTQLYPVNFNCPGQITVSGLASEMPAFTAAVKAAGGRAIPLKVKGAFHSPFMQEASEAFREDLKAAEMTQPRMDLYSDATARVYDGDPVELLASQIVRPVRWEELIRQMIEAGVDTFVEIGPGKTLTNMIAKIDPSVKAVTYAELLED
ncbi:MAG: ACP S-malonyltransferase [Lachnospiraceae bacterium]|nr:ACP S-malonyltransferase [Lachnospiraceae bacterium]